MIYSNERKLQLSGWLQEAHLTEYNSPLKLQKFLLFYEAFTKTMGETPDFSHLRGWKRGPVFSNVWGDYTKERHAFNSAATKAYENSHDSINLMRAKKCAFLVGTLTEAELSELTHHLNLWKSKECRIMSGEHQVDLYESDFNESDESMIKSLDSMYPAEMIEESEIINLDKFYFVLPRRAMHQLTEAHMDILTSLTEHEDLHNPVYVDIDEKGRLIVD